MGEMTVGELADLLGKEPVGTIVVFGGGGDPWEKIDGDSWCSVRDHKRVVPWVTFSIAVTCVYSDQPWALY